MWEGRGGNTDGIHWLERGANGVSWHAQAGTDLQNNIFDTRRAHALSLRAHPLLLVSSCQEVLPPSARFPLHSALHCLSNS